MSINTKLSNLQISTLLLYIIAIQGLATTPATADNPGDLITKLEMSANRSTTLSPFVMTSGHTDADLHNFDTDITQVNAALQAWEFSTILHALFLSLRFHVVMENLVKSWIWMTNFKDQKSHGWKLEILQHKNMTFWSNIKCNIPGSILMYTWWGSLHALGWVLNSHEISFIYHRKVMEFKGHKLVWGNLD